MKWPSLKHLNGSFSQSWRLTGIRRFYFARILSSKSVLTIAGENDFWIRRYPYRSGFQVMKISSRTASSRELMGADEDGNWDPEVFLSRLCQTSTNSSGRSYVMENDFLVKELVRLLRDHIEQSHESLTLAINTVSNLTNEESMVLLLMKLGVSSPLIQLLHAGPESVKGDVAFCIHQLHERSTKTSKLLLSTTQSVISSYVLYNSVVEACIPPLLKMLCSDSSFAYGAVHISCDGQENVLDALLRCTMRDLKLTTIMIRNNAFQRLIPMFFSGL